MIPYLQSDAFLIVAALAGFVKLLPVNICYIKVLTPDQDKLLSLHCMICHKVLDADVCSALLHVI